MNLKIFGTHDDNTIVQMKNCLQAGGEKGVLCADGHKGYAQPVGGVVSFRDAVSVSGVGFDIACGNLALRTNIKESDVAPHIDKIMDDIVSQISFGVGRVNATPVDHPLFDDEAWSMNGIKELKSLAQQQLGTVGQGNHYCDVLVDENGFVWIGVHFGSRGLGHKTATHFLKLAGGKDGMDVAPTILKTTEALGGDYIRAMNLAGRYAYAGREYVARHIATNILKAGIEEEVHNHHNFAWKEQHDGETFWVVRKGATPAFPGQKGFIGGSMGDDAVIVEGVDSKLSKEALYSTVHGAGRVMSRTDAKGKLVKDPSNPKKSVRKPGRINKNEMMKWLADKGVTLRGADVDESPQAYRRLKDVLTSHDGTIKILHTLRPIGVAMAGSDIVDPYKD